MEERLVPTILGSEQEFVYLLNLARNNPAAYQREYNLPVDLSTVASQPPLAVNDILFNSTGFHVSDMVTRNYFAHTTPQGITPNQMVRNSVSGNPLFSGPGYALPSWYPIIGNNVESIAAGTFWTSPATVLNALIVDAGINPPGHRIHLLGMEPFFADHREIGVGHAYGATAYYRNYWAVHTAVSNTSDQFITGVVFTDANGDSRYQAGEGVGGITVTLTSGSIVRTVQANSQGGYSIPIRGLGLTSAVISIAGSSASIQIGTANVAVDFITGNPNGIVNFNAPPANTAPVVRGNLTLPGILEDDSNPPSNALADLLSAVITDANATDPRGIAIIGTTGVGTWQYSTDNFQTVAVPFGSVSPSSALLLTGAHQIRFVPAPNYHGTATFSFRAWDQSTGTAEQTADLSLSTAVGGRTAFSTAVGTTRITITPVNDAPVIAPDASPALPAIREDTASASVTIGSLLRGIVSDVDVGALRGIAITAVDTSLGNWFYSTNGGLSFLRFPAVSPSAALLLRDIDRVRFVPFANANGTSTFSFHAWDRTSGGVNQRADLTLATGGTTAFSTTSAKASITVLPVNDAPRIAGIDLTFNNLTRNLLDQQFRLTVNRLTTSPIRYDPGFTDGVPNLVAAVQAALDEVLQAGTTVVRLSRLTANQMVLSISPAGPLARTGYLAVTATNISLGGGAPVVTASSPYLPSVSVFDTDPAWVSVGDLAGPFLTDIDGGDTLGIAVVGLVGTTVGQWQYWRDGEPTYTAFGSVSLTVAQLFRANDRLRFVPNPGYTQFLATNTLPSIVYRAWDQTRGTPGLPISTLSNGGVTAFSTALQRARVIVNDAPVLTPTNRHLGSFVSTRAVTFRVADLLGTSVQDAGLSTQKGIALSGLTTTTGGRWFYSTNGGLTYRQVPTLLSETGSLLLRAGDRLRYVPLAGETGVVSLTYRAWDQTSGGAGQLADLTLPGVVDERGAFSSSTDTLTLNLV